MRRLTFWVCAAVAAAFVLPAHAHGPTPHKIEKTVVIDQPAAEVWAEVKNFCDIANWHALVKSCHASGGNKFDGKRDLVLSSGAAITDSLDEYAPGEMSYSYRLETPDLKRFPVSSYSATLQVLPAGEGKSKVDWIARYYRADTRNFPPEDQGDEAAEAAMTAFYEQGLASLKAKLEGKLGF